MIDIKGDPNTLMKRNKSAHRPPTIDPYHQPQLPDLPVGINRPGGRVFCVRVRVARLIGWESLSLHDGETDARTPLVLPRWWGEEEEERPLLKS